jgi:hypothetical protein
MIGWPTGWREATLRHAGIEPAQMALDILSAWQRSTPVHPGTHNPLGMPSKGTSNVPYLGTPYALFGTMADFRHHLERFLSSRKGAELRGVLDGGESLPAAWRAIHALPWPAVATETDYPAVLLDMIGAAYASKVANGNKGKRKTTGHPRPEPVTHEAIRQQAYTLHRAAVVMNDAGHAIGSIMERMS